jgi:KDO2-lipid IV(A) lauroyltransferase
MDSISAPKPPPVRPRHRLEHALIRGVSATVGWLPEGVATALGSTLGWMAGSGLRIRRGVIHENLRRAFPEAAPGWIRRVAAASFRHLGREGVSILRMDRLGREAVRARTELVGEAHLTDALEAGKGVVLLTGHFGNWEIGGAALAARGVPLDVVARSQNNPLFDARLNAMRTGLGMRVVDRRGSTKTLLRSLREGRVVALVADQNVQSAGVFVPFFGIPAATARGSALLATRTGAALIFAAAVRLPGGRARYRVTLTPIEPPPPDASDPDLLVLERYLGHLEAAIREHPAQYLWAHRRWKTRPAHEGARDVGSPPSKEPPSAGTVPDTRNSLPTLSAAPEDERP